MRKYGYRPFLILHEEDDGGGSGGGGNPAGKTDPPAGVGTGAGDPDPPPPGGTDSGKVFTQADLDAIAAKTRREEKQKYDRLKAEEQGQFKDLYDAEKVKLSTMESELNTRNSRLTALETRVNAQIEAEVKDWPEEVKSMDPGTENLELRLAWAEKSRPLAKRIREFDKAPDGEHGGKGGDDSDNDLVGGFLRRTYQPQTAGSK